VILQCVEGLFSVFSQLGNGLRQAGEQDKQVKARGQQKRPVRSALFPGAGDLCDTRKCPTFTTFRAVFGEVSQEANFQRMHRGATLS